MRLLLHDARIDHIIAGRRAFLLVGIVLMTLPYIFPTGWGFGLTGFMFLSLGICASALSRWRTEPGLWMLALLLALSLGASWGYFECLSLGTLFARPVAGLAQQKKTWEQVGFATDAGIALALFGTIVRFVASAAAENWTQTKALGRNA